MDQSSHLPSPRVLLGPGPSGVSPRVLSALAKPPIGYLDPDLFRLLDSVRAGLREAFGTSNPFTIPLTGTGMAGMECCIANLIEEGDRAVIAINGFFGGRMAEIARRYGADVTEVQFEWGQPVDPAVLRSALQNAGKVKLVGCVHAETSTGVESPIAEIGKLVQECGAIFLADTVTSLGGMKVGLDEAGVGAAYSASQKCMGAPPGLAPISVSDAALEAAAKRKSPVRAWYFDWTLLRAYYDAPHQYHHTVPVNLYYALAESLQEIAEEGLEARFARHRSVSARLVDVMSALQASPFASSGHRLPMLNTFTLPPGVDDEVDVRRALLERYGLEIGGGLGALKGKLWRIGLMGDSARDRNVMLLGAALRETVPGA